MSIPSKTPSSEGELWDTIADKFNQQPRPKDYVDDSGYDDTAGIFIDELVTIVESYATTKALEIVQSLECMQEEPVIRGTFTGTNEFVRQQDVMAIRNQLRFQIREELKERVG